MSSTEIEDVLSSIRRLVSDDMRPAVRVAAAAKPAAVTAADKLILTPALRVVDDAPPIFGSKRLHLNIPDQPDTTAAAEPAAMGAAIGTVVAGFGAAVDATDSEWEAENGDQSIVIDDAVLVRDWKSFEADENIDEIYTAENATASGFDDDVLHKSEAAIAGWAQPDDSGDLREIAEPPLGQKTDALWMDAAEASVIAALATSGKASDLDEVLQADHDVDQDRAQDEGMRYNGDVLRELVRDVLREELAGKLGERITRNIRKLVRVEIARSMDTQDLS